MYSALSRPGGTIEYLNSRIIATIKPRKQYNDR